MTQFIQQRFFKFVLVFLCLGLPLPVYAQAESGGGFQSLIGIGLMILIFFVFIIWPQARKAKKHQELVKSLEKGDEVLTSSGLYGKISDLSDQVVTLELAPNVKVKFDRQTVAAKQSPEKLAS